MQLTWDGDVDLLRKDGQVVERSWARSKTFGLSLGEGELSCSWDAENWVTVQKKILDNIFSSGTGL